MNENDETLDLLDLEDDTELTAMPDAGPFAAPRPAKPWLLLGVGVLVIALATYIIIRAVGTDTESSVEIDLDAPAVVTIDGNSAETVVVTPAEPEPVKIEPKPEPAPTIPTREIEDRANVTFNPDAKPAAKPAPKPVAKPAAPKPTSAKAPVGKPAGGWYVQFGSYGTRAAAESAQKKIQGQHSGLMAGKQFVILAAQVNGKTTYRLRIAFANQNDANMFCRNAKSDGLDCYVAK